MAQERNKVRQELITPDVYPGFRAIGSSAHAAGFDALPTLSEYISRLEADPRWKKLSAYSFSAPISHHLDLGEDYIQIAVLDKDRDLYETAEKRCWDTQKIENAIPLLRQIVSDAYQSPSYWRVMKRDRKVEIARRRLTAIADDIGYYPATETSYASIIKPRTRYSFGSFKIGRPHESLTLWGVNRDNYKLIMKLVNILREAFNPKVTGIGPQGRPPLGGTGQSLDSGYYNIQLMCIWDARPLLHTLYDMLSKAQKKIMPSKRLIPAGSIRVRRILGEDYRRWEYAVNGDSDQKGSISRPKRKVSLLLAPTLLSIGLDSIELLGSACYSKSSPFPGTRNGWVKFFKGVFPRLLKNAGLGAFKPSTVRTLLNQWAREEEIQRRRAFGRRDFHVERW